MFEKTCLTYDYIVTKLTNKISIEKYQEYLTQEYIKQLNKISNLSQIETKSIEELCPVLNYLISKNIYYINSGKILLSINPGQSETKNTYFYLKEWYESVSLLQFNKWPPHIYSTAHSCYAQMIEENKDQAIVLTGPIGAGKSYNAHKLIQYLFFISSPSNFNKETYEVINKGMKIMNIMNSIYQKHNLNSSSSGMVYHIGFTPSNEIAFFDIDSEILDCTLPFSENGRSFTLLHGFALTHLQLSKIHKKNYNLFNKYFSSFPKNIIESFNKKDIETWETFTDHCHSFLTEIEFREILIGLEIIILINEISLLKTKASGDNVRTEVSFRKSKVTQRIASLLNVNEQKLIEILQSNAPVNQQKTLLVSLMKYTYCCIHDFVLKKVKHKFSQILDCRGSKYIHIVDFPGQINHQTLGGMILNFANECLNLYSMSNYTSILSQFESERIRLKAMNTPLSYKIIKGLIGDKGILRSLSKKSNSQKNINSFKVENDLNTSVFEFNSLTNSIKVNFSYASVVYNYNDLHMETHTLIIPNAVLKLLMSSKIGFYSINQMSNSASITIPIHEYFTNKLRYLLCGLETIEPFVVHCINSNNSYSNYFNNNCIQIINNPKEEEIFITRNLLFNNIAQGLIIPTLYWEWNGYEEWIDLNTFSYDFSDNYDKIVEYIKTKQEKQLLSQLDHQVSNINDRRLSNTELCKSVVSLFSLENECLIGLRYLLMKRNGYQSLKKVFNNLLCSIFKSSNPSSKNTTKAAIRNIKGTNMNKGNKTSFKTKTNEAFGEPKSPIISEPTNNNINSNQNTQRNKIISINIINQIQYSNKNNNDIWLYNQYNIDNILQRKRFNELDVNTELNQSLPIGKLLNVNRKDNDITVFLPFITLLQSKIRGFIVRKTFTRLYRYIKYNIMILQSHFRGYLLRIRFYKFIDCLKHIIYIQICYKVRFDKKTEACIKLQHQWRNHFKQLRARKQLKNNKNFISISRSVSVMKNSQLTKIQSKQYAKQLEDETDKDKIISSILHNSFLLNETKYSHYGLYKSIQNHNRKSSQFAYDSECKLEKRLMQYGRNLQLRQLKNVSKQMELDHKQYTFKPQLNENTKIINQNITKPFNERCEDYEMKRKLNLEKIKEKIPDEVKTKCTFKPQIKDIGLKRDFNDLLLWKEKVNKEKEEYRQHYKQQNKINEYICPSINSQYDKIDFSNDNVLRHHQRKYNSKMNNQFNNENEEQFAYRIENEEEIYKNVDTSSMKDVWPIELQKDYILDSD